MPHAIRFHKTGGPEVLVWEDIQLLGREYEREVARKTEDD